MEILGGLLFVVIIICVFGNLLGGACTTYNCKKEGHRVFDEAARARDAAWQREAKAKDMYYRPDPHAIIGPDPTRYSDGSIKFDSMTGKTYPKGQKH